MDLLGELRILAMPTWLKAALSTLLLSILGASIAVGVVGTTRADRPSWIEAGVSTMGVALPFVIVGAVLLFSSTGTAALQARTKRVLERTIPATLGSIWCSANLPYRAAEVTTALEGSGFGADYEVRLPPRDDDGPAARVHLRVEINVKKANVSLRVQRGRLTVKSRRKAWDNQALQATFHSHFQSTLAGAKQEGYVFAGSTFVDQDADEVTFVLVRSLPADFLWNSSEQLYFCQDLVMMVVGFLLEQPAVFAS